MQLSLNEIIQYISNPWKDILIKESNNKYFKELNNKYLQEKMLYEIYPKSEDIFSAFQLCAYSDTKVVIIGQDPYHNPNQAHGLCFSVPDGETIPPSLRNIYKELHTDIDKPIPKTGNISHWASQGVLMLNAVLTVRKNTPGSHKKLGWQIFTDFIIKHVSDNFNHVVFILWGNYAISKSKLINATKHNILTSVHPSPLSASRGFFGSNPFSKTNQYLLQHNKTPINW